MLDFGQTHTTCGSEQRKSQNNRLVSDFGQTHTTWGSEQRKSLNNRVVSDFGQTHTQHVAEKIKFTDTFLSFYSNCASNDIQHVIY